MASSHSPVETPTFWLSMHVGYACQDEGACCTAGWPIPIERPHAERVQSAIADGRLHAPVHWVGVAPAQPEEVAGILAADNDGCVFHRGRRCEIHTALGREALPSCCQHFPRDCVIDDRGVFVTLSHYCPTAARLLFTHEGPVKIVAGPPPVLVGMAEGLDARGTLPPLLTRGVLMDLAGLTAWEAHVVSWLGGDHNPDGRTSPEQVLDLLESHARSLAAWRPGRRTLVQTIAALVGQPQSDIAEPRWDEERALRAAAREALSRSTTWADDPIDLEGQSRHWRDHAAVINRFLAAHAFASWLPYQGGGLASGIRRLRLTLAVLRAEAARATDSSGGALSLSSLQGAIRQTDLLLAHLVDRRRLATVLTTRDG